MCLIGASENINDRPQILKQFAMYRFVFFVFVNQKCKSSMME